MRAESVTSRPALGYTRLMPQDTKYGRVGSETRPPRSASVLEPNSTERPLEEADDFDMIAALESHLAQDYDVDTPRHGSMVSDSNVAVRRNDAHKLHRPAYHTCQPGYLEVMEGSWQERPCPQPRDFSRTRRSTSNSYEAAYTQRPEVGQSPGDRRGAARPYADDIHISPVQYEEVYETVHLRDDDGECVIRRPL
ncbi:hypothetical protein LX36DRAFT_204238 [Colletotrichum falcatum]|nr:hypothetical protein LX36DRAFT_204238 [Colletotrichum falcatum]